MKAKIENWCLTLIGDAYTAPECRTTVVAGKVFEREGFAAGSHIVTSKIVDSGPDWVKTASGTVYKLGKISDEYTVYLEKKGLMVDPAHAGLTIKRPVEEKVEAINLRSNTNPFAEDTLFARAVSTKDRQRGGRFFYTFELCSGILVERGGVLG